MALDVRSRSFVQTLSQLDHGMVEVVVKSLSEIVQAVVQQVVKSLSEIDQVVGERQRY